MPPEELDAVELAISVFGWPAGTPGTVVAVPAEGWLTVEINNDLLPPEADLLDALLDLPANAVRVRSRHPQPA